MPLFFIYVFFDKYFSTGGGIDFRPVHQTGISGRRRGKNLHLLRVDPQLAGGEFLETVHVSFRTAGMGGDEIVSQKFPACGIFIQLFKNVPEFSVFLIFL